MERLFFREKGMILLLEDESMSYYYRIENGRIRGLSKENIGKEDKPVLAVLENKEAAKNLFLQSLGYSTVCGTNVIRLCKVEIHPCFMYGTYRTPFPDKQGGRFAFILDRDHLYFIEENKFAQRLLYDLQKIFLEKEGGVGTVLEAVIENLLKDDLERLAQMEIQLAHLEDEMLSGNISAFDQKIVGIRKEILRYSHYYLQLQEITDALLKNDLEIFSQEDLRRLRLLREKTGRFHQEACLLREYSIQIREVYQAQIEIRQNKIMKTLTVVTAIFLPLTLIAGWYGMNFSYMPELHWRYGYPLVIGLSILIVSVSLYLCHKKRFYK